MSFCSKCGREVSDDANYCSACGNTLMHTGTETTYNSEQSSNSSKPKAKLFLCMLFALFIVAGAVILILIAPWKKVPFSDNTDEIKKASESVVLLQCYDKNGELYCTGSAFAAFEEGIFVTNYHVVEQEVYRIVACTEDNTMFEINSVLAADSKRDIAILKTDSYTNISPLMIGSSSNLEKGEKVIAIGSPLGFLNTVSTGVFSGYIENDTIQELQFSASISHGSSGGALFNNQGEVIGITCGSYEDGQNLNISVPIQYVSDLMNTPASPLTIEQFYDTFDHFTYYAVDDVIGNRNTMSDDKAVIYGYIADIDGKRCYLVSNKSEIDNFKINFRENVSFDEYRKLLENGFWDQYTESELKCVIEVQDLTQDGKVFSQYRVGDFVYIETSLSPQRSTNVRVQIYIRNCNDMSTVVQ